MAQPRKKEKQRMRTHVKEQRSFTWQIIFGILRFLILSGCIALIWYISRLEFFTLTDVSVSGGETISHEEIQNIVRSELKGSYVLIVPKQFSYFYPHDRIVEVLSKNPRIHDVYVSRTSRRSLSVTFQEYLPHALWCVDTIEQLPCYFITSTGYLFSEAPELTGGTLTRHITEGVTELSKGEIISSEKLLQVDTFIQRANDEHELRISSVRYTRDNDIEFSINGGGKIFVSGGKDLTTAFENLVSVLLSAEFKHIAPGNFQYIDLRFDNKVFVNESQEAILSTTTESSSELPE